MYNKKKFDEAGRCLEQRGPDSEGMIVNLFVFDIGTRQMVCKVFRAMI